MPKTYSTNNSDISRSANATMRLQLSRLCLRNSVRHPLISPSSHNLTDPAFRAAFCAVMIGYDSAFIGGTIALSSFKKEFNWSQYSTNEQNLISENIVSLYQAGAFFGAFFAYAAGHYLGRKRGLQIFSAVFVLGAGLMLGTNGKRGLGLLYAGRVLAGVGVGGASNLTPIYISELAPPAIRGRLVGLYEMGWQIGGVVGFWINVGVFSLSSQRDTDIYLVWRFYHDA
jgi:MFS family permease